MKMQVIAAIAATVLAGLLSASPAQAQATRTWVSGVGDDVNPCSRTAPCKTFAGAISKTATAGEINCLDPGGFGGVTITKAMTLNCHEVFGSILVQGTPGVTISAAGATVVLRGLQIQGLVGTVTPGTIGVRILAAAKVSIEDCVITQFSQQGIADTRAGSGNFLSVRNTVLSQNTGAGISAGAGTTSGTVLENVHSISNGFGLATATGNNVMVSRSVMSGNSSAGIEADVGAQVFVDNTVVTNNGNGIQPAGNVVLANSDISFNNVGITAATTSFGNNRIFGNSSAGTAPTVGAASSDHGQQ